MHPTGLTVAQLLAAYRAGSLSPVEAVEAYLERIAQHDAALHAYVQVHADAARGQARASQARWRSGRPCGLLDGVPIAVKDLVHLAGRTTAAGSTMYVDRPAESVTAALAQRLLDAGAVVLGKVHLPELAYGGWGTNAGLGTPRNPWDTTRHRVPGGSSSGSAVAVASGMAAAAIGTDTGGSVRIPAAFCGLTGLRPSLGRVSHHGMELVSHTLDTAGPLAWTAEDAALLHQVIHGPDPHDPVTHSLAPQDVMASLHDPVDGVRISLAARGGLGPLDAGVWEATTDAVRALETLGCVRRDDAFAEVDFAADQEAAGVIISTEVYARHGRALEATTRAGDAAARSRVLRGASIDPARYRAALADRRARSDAFAQVFRDTDVLVLPTLPLTARRLEAIDEADLSPSRLTRFVGYYGLCAIALPSGPDAEGLPMSVQLVAAHGRDALLLRLGAAFQRVTPHHLQRPPAGPWH